MTISQNRFIDNDISKKLMKIIKTPWEELPLVKSGIVDEKGNFKIPLTKQTPDQKKSYTKLDIILLTLKHLIELTPFTLKTMQNLNMNLKLVRECVSEESATIMENTLTKYLQDIEILEDDTPTNTTSGVDMPQNVLGKGGDMCGPDRRSLLSFRQFVKKKKLKNDNQ